MNSDPRRITREELTQQLGILSKTMLFRHSGNQPNASWLITYALAAMKRGDDLEAAAMMAHALTAFVMGDDAGQHVIDRYQAIIRREMRDRAA